MLQFIVYNNLLVAFELLFYMMRPLCTQKKHQIAPKKQQIMRSTHTFTIRFTLRQNKSKDGTAPIRMVINVDGVRKEVAIKKRIAIEDWNSTKGMARTNRPALRQLNLALEDIRIQIWAIYQTMRHNGEIITAEKIKNSFMGTDEDDTTLCKLIDYHYKVASQTLAEGTIKNYYATERYLKEFLLKQFKTTDIRLEKLNYKFITDFEYFLRCREPYILHKPLTNNGVMKHLERLKKLIHMAIRLEWMERDPFASYQLSFKKVEREHLSEKELQRLEETSFTNNNMQLVADLFIFSCYTGLAYIDVIQLKPQNLIQGIDGEIWLSFIREKTQHPVMLPILPKAMTIISKYENHPKAKRKETLFPFITNQTVNKLLKFIAQHIETAKQLTFHMARHTFATTITLNNGVPIETVSKLLGHTKITTTQIYARVGETKISQDIAALKINLNQTKSNIMQIKKID